MFIHFLKKIIKMVVSINRGKKGIKGYLETAQKKDRDFTRDVADKRVILEGDLELTDAIIKTVPTQSKYYHIVLSWKEDEVSIEDMQKAIKEFKEFAFKAYKDTEYNFYAEAHLPKLKSYVDKKTGEVKIRKPHLHIVVPEINLESGLKLKPLGFIKNQSINYIDAFTEKFNMENGFASAKDNRSNLLKNHNIVLREEILNAILKEKINSFEDFKSYLENNFDNVKVRNAKKENPYFNVKPEYHLKGTNLNDFVFSKEFIENYSYEDKLYFLAQSAEKEEFIEKKEPSINKQKMKEYDNQLSYWNELISREIKYISQNTKYYKEVYKFLLKEEKIEVLNQKEQEYYKKYDLKAQIEDEIKDISNEDIENLIMEKSPKAKNEKHNFVSQKLENIKEDNALSKIDFQKINLKRVYEILKSEKGVLDVKYKLNEKQDVIKAGSKELDSKEFLVEQMNLLADEIHLLGKSIQKIEEIDYNKNLSNMIEKGNSMAIQVNVKTNAKDKNQIDYMQVGTVDRIGRYIGFIYDQADNQNKSSATLFVVNDKVVDFEEFRKLPNYKELDNKMNSLVNASKEEHYSKELKMNYIKENLSLTQQGQSYANSKFNFNELRPIEAGISKFDNMKSLDKNIFTKAKEFVLENWYKGKDKIQFMLTSKKDLAASNVLLAAELKEMKASLEHIKTYQQALKEKNKLLQQQIPKENNITSGETESSKDNKKEFTFKEVYQKVKDLDGKLDNAKDIKELSDYSQDFIEKRDTALELLNNIKVNSSLINLDENQFNSLTQKEAHTLNLMVDNKISVNSKDSIGKVIDVLKNVQTMSIEQELDFEQLLSKTMDKLVEKHAVKVQQKETEQER